MKEGQNDRKKERKKGSSFWVVFVVVAVGYCSIINAHPHSDLNA